MSNSTPQGPGPQFGSNPDATPVDETEAVQEAMDEESAELAAEGDDGTIDLSAPEGPEVSGGDDVD
ncbi:hypothetical protein [Amnibacterium kyonggiense]